MSRPNPEDFDRGESSSKYDGLARALLADLHAEAVVVVVIGGDMGSGACPALRLGTQVRLTTAALRIAFLEMAERVVADGERAAREWEKVKP
jgi:hypothetical protein